MNEKLSAAARVLVGIVFVYSGFLKAVGPTQEFAAVIEAYYLLPNNWVMPMATLLPWAQLIFGVFLACGYLTRPSAAAIGGMLAMFLIAVSSAQLKGVPLDHCGCFGDAIRLTPAQTMGLDVILFAMAVLAFRHGRELWSLDRWIDSGA